MFFRVIWREEILFALGKQKVLSIWRVLDKMSVAPDTLVLRR
jgi:hypothetical protein